MDLQHEIGRVHGRLDGHDQEIGGIREQTSRIEGGVGSLGAHMERIESKLDQVIGSGPHVAIRSDQSATERNETGKFGIVKTIASKYGREAILVVGMLAGWGMYLSAKTGRPIDSFVPGRETPVSRPALDHTDQENTWPEASSSLPRSSRSPAAMKPEIRP
jgi:hypothetical protein